MDFLLRLGLLGLFLVAGISVTVRVLNRRLIHIPDMARQRWLTVFLGLVLSGLGAWAGWILPITPGAFVFPAAVLSVLAASRLGQRIRGARLRGTGPKESRVCLEGGAALSTASLVSHRFQVPLRTWSGPPLRILHLTDLHLDPSMPEGYFEKALAAAAKVDADLALLTGDFVTRPEGLALIPGLLGPLARHGTFAVLGNHDHWVDGPGVRQSLLDAGVVVVDRAPALVEIKGSRIRICGDELPWGARSSSREGEVGVDLQITLTHTPDNFFRLAGEDADLVFAGHLHRGQIRIPWFGPVVIPSAHGMVLEHGHYLRRETHLFVSAGIGTVGLPLRMFSPPDFFIVDVVSGIV